jgi:hypothetical protein
VVRYRSNHLMKLQEEEHGEKRKIFSQL